MVLTHDIYTYLSKIIDLPTDSTMIKIILEVNQPVIIDCTYYPEKTNMDESGEIKTENKRYVLVDIDEE